MNLKTPIPIYTTRPHGRGKETGSYTAPAILPLLAIPLVFLNVILWSMYGLYLLVRLVVG